MGKRGAADAPVIGAVLLLWARIGLAGRIVLLVLGGVLISTVPGVVSSPETDVATLRVVYVQNALWAGYWTFVAGSIAYRFRHQSRLRAAGWMILIAGGLILQEEPAVLTLAASVVPGPNPDGALGLVDSHIRGHMYGGAVLGLAGVVVCIIIAQNWLRRGDRTAWTALLVFLLLVASIHIVEVLFIYPHGFPIGATPPDGRRGWGWFTIAAWILIWASALAYSRGQLREGTQQTT